MHFRTISHIEDTLYSIGLSKFNILINPIEKDVLKILREDYRKVHDRMDPPYNKGGLTGFRGLFYKDDFVIWTSGATHEEVGVYLKVKWDFAETFQCWPLDISEHSYEDGKILFGIYEPNGSTEMNSHTSCLATIKALHGFNKAMSQDFLDRYVSQSSSERDINFMNNLQNSLKPR